MSDNHPMLPPKSRFFEWNEEDDEWDFIYHEYRMNEPHKMHVGLSYCTPDWDVPYIAAVAEVEWRKRGERWDALAYRNEYASKHSSYSLAATVCYANAMAWRAWGMKK